MLGELSKIATHYGIIRRGALIRELQAGEMSSERRDFVFVKTNHDLRAKEVLRGRYAEVEARDEGLRVYGEQESACVSKLLFESGIAAREISFKKVGLEECCLKIMSRKDGCQDG
jgi:ABC-2 type transport system ATP-binding protein